MNEKGKIGICVERGHIADPRSIKLAERGILSFLKTRGHIAGKEQPTNQVHIIMKTIYLTKTDRFVLKKHFKNFETVSMGQIIGYDGGKEVVAKKEGIILFAHSRDKIRSEAFLLGEKNNIYVGNRKKRISE
jgi:predicted deacylase